MVGRSFTMGHLACDAENIEIAKALIYAGAYINPRMHNLNTPLDLALKRDNFELVKLLLSHGAITLNGVSSYLERSKNLRNLDINAALRNKILSVRNYLLEYSIKDIDIHTDCTKDEIYSLFRGAVHGNNIELANKILENNMMAVIEVKLKELSFRRKYMHLYQKCMAGIQKASNLDRASSQVNASLIPF